MRTDNRFLDDMARAMAGAMSVAAGARNEVEARMRQRAEAFLVRMDLVRREEFEIVRDMATLARRENEHLAARVAELESTLAGAAAKKPASRKRTPAKKASSAKAKRTASTETGESSAG